MRLNSEISAVVTGGASGLGEATARALAARGVKVAIFDLNVERGEALASELGGIFCEVNVTRDDSVDAGFERARAAHGQERILVNCAGGGKSMKTISRDRETGAIRSHDIRHFLNVLDLNTGGSFRCIAKAAAGMATLELVDGERGAIVNTASAAAKEGQIGQAAYGAAKAAIVGMTLPIARDLSSEAIRINTIMPGTFATPPMMGAPEKVRETLAASVPFPKRLGDPAEFASMAIELLSNGYMNGETIRLDGAIRMPPR